MNWGLIYTYPVDDKLEQYEKDLAALIVSHGGVFEGGETVSGQRDTVGLFRARKSADNCGRAAWYLYIPFLSWFVDEIHEK